jgi:hypothetical protein
MNPKGARVVVKVRPLMKPTGGGHQRVVFIRSAKAVIG